MILSRDQEIDAAFALSSLPSVTGVYVIPPLRGDMLSSHPDALKLAIVLRPYSIHVMVERIIGFSASQAMK
jgi:hypothetical protein